MRQSLQFLDHLSLPVLIIASFSVVSLLAWAYRPLLSALVLVPYRVTRRGEVHRLLTSAWVHADFGHLFMNGLTLYLLAAGSLKALGSTRFLVLYFSAAIVASLPTTLRFMKQPNYSSLGASGAIAAVLFSSILLNLNQRLALFGIAPLPAYVFAGGYLAYSAWHSYQNTGHINHDAHFTGAVYGCLLTAVFEPDLVQHSVRVFMRSL